jgi:hypothetical protein
VFAENSPVPLLGHHHSPNSQSFTTLRLDRHGPRGPAQVGTARNGRTLRWRERLNVIRFAGLGSLRRLAPLALPESSRSAGGVPFGDSLRTSFDSPVEHPPTQVLLDFLEPAPPPGPSAFNSSCGSVQNAGR